MRHVERGGAVRTEILKVELAAEKTRRLDAEHAAQLAELEAGALRQVLVANGIDPPAFTHRRG